MAKQIIDKAMKKFLKIDGLIAILVFTTFYIFRKGTIPIVLFGLVVKFIYLLKFLKDEKNGKCKRTYKRCSRNHDASYPSSVHSDSIHDRNETI